MGEYATGIFKYQEMVTQTFYGAWIQIAAELPLRGVEYVLWDHDSLSWDNSHQTFFTLPHAPLNK